MTFNAKNGVCWTRKRKRRVVGMVLASALWRKR